MNDIVFRIHTHVHGEPQKTSEFLLDLASAEIERLREENEKLRAQIAELLPWAKAGATDRIDNLNSWLDHLGTPEDGQAIWDRIDAGEFGEGARLMLSLAVMEKSAMAEVACLTDEVEDLRAQVTELLPWAYKALMGGSFVQTIGDEGDELLDRIKTGEFGEVEQ